MQEQATEMQQIKTTGSSRKGWETETCALKADRNAIKAVQHTLPDNREGQIHLHKHTEATKNVTKMDWENKAKISDHFAQCAAKFIKMFSECGAT